MTDSDKIDLFSHVASEFERIIAKATGTPVAAELKLRPADNRTTYRALKQPKPTP